MTCRYYDLEVDGQQYHVAEYRVVMNGRVSPNLRYEVFVPWPPEKPLPRRVAARRDEHGWWHGVPDDEIRKVVAHLFRTVLQRPMERMQLRHPPGGVPVVIQYAP